MAHALDMTTGKAGMAYIGETPWHGLGQALSPGADLLTWQMEAGLDWSCKRAGVEFDRLVQDVGGKETPLKSKAKDYNVLYRSDTGAVLSVVSPRYKPVQPKEIIEFYRDLVASHGFELETAGSIKDGRKIWALANTNRATALPGGDELRGYLLLATSYDGTMATQARFTSVRVVCNNTLSFATADNAGAIIVPHSTTFDANKVKIDLKVGDAWAAFAAKADDMAHRVIGKEETARFLLDVYLGLDTDEKIGAARADEKTDKSIQKFIGRITDQLFNSPGAHLASARGTLWGVLNAVTRDVDFAIPARSQENRLNSAWFGKGNSIKQRAWDKALAKVA